mmetsp:Transcript_34003/g.74628  ORF Transcript_34003/g.74628 Transcript_34003/m.74628 type:complete len:277 (-) Transcript_34003:554-1384(-)
MPVLGARDVDVWILWAKIDAEACGASRDDALRAERLGRVAALLGRGGHALEHHQLRLLEPLLHVPLHDAPVGRDGDEVLATALGAVVDPAQRPHRVGVLAVGGAALERRLGLVLANVVNADSAVVQPRREQIRVLARKGDAGDAARHADDLVRVGGVLERPEEDEPVALRRKVELAVGHRQHVVLHRVPLEARNVAARALLRLEAPQVLHPRGRRPRRLLHNVAVGEVRLVIRVLRDDALGDAQRGWQVWQRVDRRLHRLGRRLLPHVGRVDARRH